MIIDVTVLVARQCDRYASAKIKDYEPGFLERIVRLSTTKKARLLHYFPPNENSQRLQEGSEREIITPEDSWCTTHVSSFDTLNQLCRFFVVCRRYSIAKAIKKKEAYVLYSPRSIMDASLD